MNFDDLLKDLILAATRKALASSLSQVDQLFALLEPHMDEEVLQKIKQSFEDQIRRELSGG